MKCYGAFFVLVCSVQALGMEKKVEAIKRDVQKKDSFTQSKPIDLPANVKLDELTPIRAEEIQNYIGKIVLRKKNSIPQFESVRLDGFTGVGNFYMVYSKIDHNTSAGIVCDLKDLYPTFNQENGNSK